MSWSCEPCSTRAPLSSTTMRSAFAKVDSRWAMTRVVRGAVPDGWSLLCAMTWSRAACTFFSLWLSSAAVASSSSRPRGLRRSARAMATRCFCPPESRLPREPQ
mmetsp:Transcript_67775/g.109175  ORF Transcript_67775/g.109175 Transcript_67775/m.109175 type:complete len:104 (-) Transcript_67775:294-605(-)